jgi:prepilin-type N-terminal cleavage/methylation domain-containing protein
VKLLNAPRKRYSAKAHGRGFTLLEVIVALAIFSVTAVVALRIVSAVTRSAAVSGDYLTAVMIAESQLAQVVAEGPRAAGSGWVEDYYHWRVTAEALAIDGGDLEESWSGNDLEPYHFQVVVSWGDGPRQFQLDTVRLVSRQ